jgi:hypothetical protein
MDNNNRSIKSDDDNDDDDDDTVEHLRLDVCLLVFFVRLDTLQLAMVVDSHLTIL